MLKIMDRDSWVMKCSGIVVEGHREKGRQQKTCNKFFEC